MGLLAARIIADMTTDEEAEDSFLHHLDPCDHRAHSRLLEDLHYWVKFKKRIEQKLATDSDSTDLAIYIGRVHALDEWANVAILNLAECGDELLITREVAESEFDALLAIERASRDALAAEDARHEAAQQAQTLAQTREDLRRYGRHAAECASRRQSTDLVPGTLAYRQDACDCGYHEALERAKQ